MSEETKKTKSEAALREERVLAFWKDNKTFDKSLEQTAGKKEFIFYEGPPTANGKPGIHHLEARAFKDAIPRYKTMQGFHVRRKGGWDTHGLPVELQVEKKLGLNSKKAIEEYGVGKFNQECKESVWEYLDTWNKFTKRIGFWVDQEHPYVTYHNDFIESVWNVVKKTNEQDLLYKDYRVVPWCPRCGTALSSHELAQGYEDVKDLSVTAKFKIVGTTNGYFLAWTTTPWTLPGNVGLAVGKDIVYVEAKVGGEILVLAKDRLSIITEPYEIIAEHKGSEMVGMQYEPLYPYFADTISGKEKEKMDKAYKVYEADFVNTTDGTGIVHTAVMYGQDDFVLGTKVGLPKHHLVGLDGKFLPGTGPFEGRFVKDEEVAVDIIKDLAHRGLLFKKEKYEHSYPHCWRCHTALIYYARDSWYIRMSDLKIKKELITENEKINWEPAHIREGRFGEWLREIKDWAISRERYWGTPLPVWECVACKKREVVGSIADLKEKAKKSGNKYFIMRHGEAGNNVNNLYYKEINIKAELTEKGKKEVLIAAKKMKQKFDVIIASPFTRSRETAKILCKEIDFPLEKVIYDARVQEWELSSAFEGKDRAVFRHYYDHEYLNNPKQSLPDGESFAEVVKRVGDFIYETDKKYAGKNILILAHQGSSRALSFVGQGLSFDDLSIEHNPFILMNNAEVKPFDFVPLPHNTDYELDLHRPYIDEVKLACSCGGDLVRVKEVMDVWFDSGCVPFAQDHYPFENKKWIDGPGYPADFISEAVDQTRGWFYTLHAVGVLMKRGLAFKNVICLGHLLDAKGKKMSKSLGNVVDPWDMMDKYGVDTLRLWMYSVNQPGEAKNFDEKTVALLHQQVFGLFYNVLAFYELYRDKNLENNTKPNGKNILDQWILARLDQLITLSTDNLDSYKLLEPVRAMRDFMGDLSTWYLRRSRDRIKEGDKEAKATLYFVLKTLAKLLAPFAPFAAEDVWQKLKKENEAESVHLAEWPKVKTKLFNFGKTSVLQEMDLVREIVSTLLKERQKANVPVRQALLGASGPHILVKYVEIVKDELNIKNYGIGSYGLDTNITPELKQEGDYRELVRGLQDMRKNMGLTPSDVISITFETDDVGRKIIEKFEADMKKTVLVSKIEFKNNDGQEIKIDDLIFKVKIEK